MRIDITIVSGIRTVDLSVASTRPDGSRATLGHILQDPETSNQISAPEGAAFRVRGAQVDPDVYVLEAGDRITVEKRASDKS